MYIARQNKSERDYICPMQQPDKINVPVFIRVRPVIAHQFINFHRPPSVRTHTVTSARAANIKLSILHSEIYRDFPTPATRTGAAGRSAADGHRSCWQERIISVEYTQLGEKEICIFSDWTFCAVMRCNEG